MAASHGVSRAPWYYGSGTPTGRVLFAYRTITVFGSAFQRIRLRICAHRRGSWEPHRPVHNTSCASAQAHHRHPRSNLRPTRCDGSTQKVSARPRSLAATCGIKLTSYLAVTSYRPTPKDRTSILRRRLKCDETRRAGAPKNHSRIWNTARIFRREAQADRAF